MLRSRLISVTCLLLLSISALAAGTPTQAELKPPQTIAELQSQLGIILKQNHIPGAGVALFNRGGVIWSGGIGYADLKRKLPVTADTLFRVGSITKSFVAVALLQLAEQGKLNLEAKLKDIAPEIPVNNPWESTDPVTVAEVLEHTAGFDDMHFHDFYDPTGNTPLIQVIHRERSALQVRWRPGTRMSYSNDDYLIAGYLLEKLSGEPYTQYLTAHVLAPLDMTQAVIHQGTIPPQLSAGYTGDDMQPVPVRWIALRPAGALMASAPELAHLGVMLLDHGMWQHTEILSAASVTRMQTPRTSLAARRGLVYGYGIANYSSYINSYEFQGHDGGIDGFLSRYVYSPTLGVGFVLLLNTDSPGNGLSAASKLIVAYLVQNLPKPVPESVVGLTPTARQALLGWWRLANPRNQLTGFADYLFSVGRVVPDGNDYLFKPWMGNSQRLIPVSGTRFRVDDNPGASAILMRNVPGSTALQIDWQYYQKVNVLSAYGLLILFIGALVLMLSSILFAPVWLGRLLARRMRGVRYWSVRLLPLASVLCLVAGFLFINQVNYAVAGAYNVHTLGLMVGTILFAILALLGLVRTLWAFGQPMNKVMRLHSLLVSLSCCGIVLMLAHYGWIGIRLWAY